MTTIPENSDISTNEEVYSPHVVTEPSSRIPRHVWNPSESLKLCTIWASVSQDPVVGADQRSNDMWNRICETFNSDEELLVFIDVGKMKSHWRKLAKKVSKFCGYFAQIKKRDQSGVTGEDEIVSQALIMYHQLEGSAFNRYSCWCVLRKSQKWNDNLQKEATKTKRKAQEQQQRCIAATAVPAVPADASAEGSRVKTACPIRHKRAKRARRDDTDNDAQEIIRCQEASNKYDEDLLKEMRRQNDIAEEMLELKRKEIELMMKQYAQNE